ncbi:peptidase G2 autoproteolytic cleavage domain-containing protein [Paenibacillus larvae]|uniref:peptidase G2 autoproteolytic cleavage domain-containing protein n=1 Tax=Paenibacillus larvae TaxID=1464 RepID=UPI00293C52FB|nr:peptidase G2 autoproteolytic cleavage domain-containing protein [Paenibacillus larvae]MDV3432379.1 peptidase G2 autoproteolytic cleavage domain-containing protein [Paenibacillus larvae]
MNHWMTNGLNQNGHGSVAEGINTVAGGVAAHAEGSGASASGNAAHAEGYMTEAIGIASHAEGHSTLAQGISSHAEGSGTTASNSHAHAEGTGTTASGESAHAEGVGTVALAEAAHAEGAQAVAEGYASHAEGSGSRAGAFATHAEGNTTKAMAFASHAEGNTTEATAFAAHAEGNSTEASAFASHAEGAGTSAGGIAAHSEGIGTSALRQDGVHIIGKFGQADSGIEGQYSWYLANGTDEKHPGLAAKVIGAFGNAYVSGYLAAGGASYAECFETKDGSPIEVGYFVTTEGDRVRKANGKDSYVIGVTTAPSGFVGDSRELHWADKYTVDEWGRVQVQEVEIPPYKDEEGKVIIPKRTELQPVLNPAWDPDIPYVSRLKRDEWVVVGLLGKLLVRDDGSCQVNGYCQPGENGIATKAKEGYRVLKRVAPERILILFRG